MNAYKLHEKRRERQCNKETKEREICVIPSFAREFLNRKLFSIKKTKIYKYRESIREEEGIKERMNGIKIIRRRVRTEKELNIMTKHYEWIYNYHLSGDYANLNLD